MVRPTPLIGHDDHIVDVDGPGLVEVDRRRANCVHEFVPTLGDAHHIGNVYVVVARVWIAVDSIRLHVSKVAIIPWR